MRSLFFPIPFLQFILSSLLFLFKLHVLLTFSLCRLHGIQMADQPSAQNPHLPPDTPIPTILQTAVTCSLFTGGKLNMPQRGGF
jgi:hypothetical protein